MRFTAAKIAATDSVVPVQIHLLDKALTAIERAGGALDRVSLAKILELTLPALDELLIELELDGRLTKDPTGRYIAPR